MKINRAKLKKLATITIEVEPETFDPIESFGYDTKAENESAAAYVRELADRSEWGWCVVTVTAEYGGQSGRDVLGGCSYASEADFKGSGYYEDMVNGAIAELAACLEAAVFAVEKVKA